MKTPPTIRIFSYNIHKGRSFLNMRHILSEIKQLITQMEHDFVFLQEVVGDSEKELHQIEDWPSNSQFEYLADEMWPHFAYGKNAVSDTSHHGNAILSKWPIISHENIDLSLNRIEQRGLLHAVVEHPETKIRLDLMGLHLNLRERHRMRQAQIIIDRVKQANDPNTPLIICGDFNDWRQNAHLMLTENLGVREALDTHGGQLGKTFPSAFPAMSLDRIYFKGAELVSARVLNEPIWERLSDHLPIEAQLTI